MKRAVTVLFVLAATRLAFPIPQAAAAGNPHNLGSCSHCHPVMPRFGIDTGADVSFTTTADDPGLCAACHPVSSHPHPVLVEAGSGPAGANRSTYLRAGKSAAFAGKIVCTSCHFIHSADTRYGLLRGFPGSPDPRYFLSAAAFCQECHGTNLSTRSAHGGGERSCVSCHAGRPEAKLLAGAAPNFKERCQLCHAGVEDRHFAEMNPFGTRRECALCHDHHAAAAVSPRLFTAAYQTAAADSVVISPHFRSGLCLSCHTNTDDYALRDEDVNALCDRCHASGQIRSNIHPLRKIPPGMVTPKGWPLSDGALTCLTCHEQGHDDQQRQPFMLRGGGSGLWHEACRHCHVANDLKKSRIHQQISEGTGCELCHKTRPRPGTDTAKTVTFIAPPDLLCLRCHDEVIDDGSAHHGDVIGREVDEGHLPEQLPLVQGRVICATCHEPHAREAGGKRLREYLAKSNFCLGCHRV